MKQILILIVIFGIASKSFGQSEFNKKFKAIPSLNANFKAKKIINPTAEIPDIISPDVFKNADILNTKPKTNHSIQLGEINNFSMVPKTDFINPGDLIVEKLNKIPFNAEGTANRKDQNFGNFKTKSYAVKVSYRDFGEVDGDAIRVFLNDRPIIAKIIMDNEFRSFDITLESGSNKIDLQALNVGYSSPNTAEFQIYDDKETLITANQWNLFTDYKATIVLIKE